VCGTSIESAMCMQQAWVARPRSSAYEQPAMLRCISVQEEFIHDLFIVSLAGWSCYGVIVLLQGPVRKLSGHCKQRVLVLLASAKLKACGSLIAAMA